MAKRKRDEDWPQKINEPVSALLLLPDDIILKILSFLDTYSLVLASKVCRKLHQVGEDVSLWRCLDARRMNLTLIHLWKLSYSKLNEKTKELHVRGRHCNTSGPIEHLPLAYLDNLNKRCPNLTGLSLEYFDLQDIPLEFLPQNISHLSLAGSMLTMGWFDVLKCRDLLISLKTLDLQYCTKVSNSDLESLCYLRNIETLLMTNCYRISARGIPGIMHNMKRLSVLDFSGCPGVNNVVLYYISRLTQLRILRIRYCHLITDNGIKSLFAFTVGATLRELDIYSCHEITDEGAIFIGQKAKELRKLDIGACKVSESTVQHLRETLTRCNVLCTRPEACACQRKVCINEPQPSRPSVLDPGFTRLGP